MAVYTLDELISGMRPPETFFKVGVTMEAAGVMHVFNYNSGRPGQMIANSAGLGGESLTYYNGQIPFYNPPSGKETYLARFGINSNVVGTAMLCDRLWHNSGIVVTTTGVQTINSTAWPARCPHASGGNTPNTSGHNIMVGIEISTQTTSASINTRMNYTNSDGVSNRTAIMASIPATAIVGTFLPFQLASGDKGVQSIQSISLNTNLTAGAIHLVAYRVLAIAHVPIAYGGGFVDFLSGGSPQLYDNTVPFITWLPSATTALTVHGNIIYSQCGNSS